MTSKNTMINKQRKPVWALLFFLLLQITVYAEVLEARFFQQHSTWYEKVPANPPLHSNSSNYVNDILINGTGFTVNHTRWSVPIWFAGSSTPYVKVNTGTDTRAAQNGWDMVPIPADAKPADAYDAHMVVISHDRKYQWDFYRASKDSSGNWYARRLRRWELSGDGVNSPYDGKGAARACPTPLTQGLITYEEIQYGRIDHALAFAYWGDKDPDHWGVYPCQIYRSGVSNRQWAMNLGERIQLDPAINVDALSLNRAGKIIAKALQEYGMIFVENCGKGCNTVYAESLDNKSLSWSGILGSMGAIPLNRLRVLNPIYPSSDPSSGNTKTKPLAPSDLRVRQ